VSGVHVLALILIVGTLSACAPPPTSLRVERFAADPTASHFETLDRTITDPAAVRELSHMLRTLPAAFAGDRFCGIGGGLRYRLTFAGTPKTSFVAIIEGDGCREAHLGSFDRRSTTESFWATLAGALGLYTRGNDLFPLPLAWRH
jgi:hypothetical protein